MRTVEISTAKKGLGYIALGIHKSPTACQRICERNVLLVLEESYFDLLQIERQIRRWLGNLVYGITPISADLVLAASYGEQPAELLALAKLDPTRWPYDKGLRGQKIGWQTDDPDLRREYLAARSLRFLAKRSSQVEVRDVLVRLARVRNDLSEIDRYPRSQIADAILHVDTLLLNDFANAGLGFWQKFQPWALDKAFDDVRPDER